MSKQFRNCNLNQAYLLPPSLDDWLPEGHLARFVAELVARSPDPIGNPRLGPSLFGSGRTPGFRITRNVPQTF